MRKDRKSIRKWTHIKNLQGFRYMKIYKKLKKSLGISGDAGVEGMPVQWDELQQNLCSQGFELVEFRDILCNAQALFSFFCCL